MAQNAVRGSNLQIEEFEMTDHVSYYAKAYIAAFVAGCSYLMSVLAPTAVLGDITLVQWIGFAVSTLGVWAGTAFMTNGPKPGTVPSVTAPYVPPVEPVAAVPPVPPVA